MLGVEIYLGFCCAYNAPRVSLWYLVGVGLAGIVVAIIQARKNGPGRGGVYFEVLYSWSLAEDSSGVLIDVSSIIVRIVYFTLRSSYFFVLTRAAYGSFF